MRYMGLFVIFVGAIGFATGQQTAGAILVFIGLTLWMIGVITEILTR